jgi:NhaA family Na+:H+ antiporter
VNGPFGGAYDTLWQLTLGWDAVGLRMDARHWVNDGLMTVFFFVVGLEIKRELVGGTLAAPRQAAVPVLAAFGGAVMPAVVFLALTWGSPAASGWGVPMATDPAFAVGVLALVARRAPAGLRVLLLTIATVDDVLAVVVIAVGYAAPVALEWLAVAVAGCLLVALLRRAGVAAFWPYLLVGAWVWYATLHSGVHATIAGVALGLLTPAGEVAGRAVLRRLLGILAPFSAFLAVPIFALGNAGVRLGSAAAQAAAGSPVTWAVIAGLVIGKFIGVVGTVALSTTTRLGRLPAGVTATHVAGLGLIAGLGFTVALFVAGLSYAEPGLIDHAKTGVLAASVLTASGAAAVLALANRRSKGSLEPDLRSSRTRQDHIS